MERLGRSKFELHSYTAVSTLFMLNMFQGPLWLFETADRTKLFTHHVFLYISTYDKAEFMN